MSATKVYFGRKALEFLPDIVGDERIIIISPVRDILVNNEVLGHIIFIKNNQLEYNETTNKFIGKPFTQKQASSGFKGSFLFIGTNPNYFNHLFQSRVSGKYGDKQIYLDQQFRGSISFEFQKILKHYLIKELN